ncbi:SRPBCC domain-containing protein [Arenibacter sp. M-2]|uniref:SRPBCC family protein n=1 Tax=Arenibacter sp. M-2 TaxID=3053612 RepID=UPI00256FEA98|nr:SRPBCC domain-containing protein [Arenibacter sp. M-2]MDL5511131.1 SRPBCC domain-containing protein [Arenibacter sp. M-2]
MRTEKLIVKDQTEINASKEKVWEVLTNPDFIRKWDDIPENYPGGYLKLGSIIEWEGYSKMTVTEFNKPSKLKMNLYLPKVELAPSAYDVNYTYFLNEENGKTTLRFEIGDFSPLPKAKDYYDASLEWVETAKKKIKELAEK